MRAASTIARGIERISIVGAGLTADRSGREVGHAGLAQSRGHRTPAALIQEIAGVGKAEAQRQVRLGSAVIESTGASQAEQHATVDTATEPQGVETGSGTESEQRAPWHAALTTALLHQRLTAVQHDAILRGLGEPPEASNDASAAWACAAAQLVDEATHRTVEELRQAARTIRDRIDPEGAARRFRERFEHRSFRMWVDQDGIHHGHIAFDDDGGAWMTTIRDAALRPRRGGPRFIDSDERKRAAALSADERTNEQLGYDLLMDVLRAGALADAASVFGTRQAGVRIVRVIDNASDEVIAQHTEDYLTPLPTASIDQRICDSGSVSATADRAGNPLSVGREQRLFTPRQRVALAHRDGGCRWRSCDRPASYCEAHHIDEWVADGGRTDVDRGILLCRYHHMQLHHGRWRISREGQSEFHLHPPGGAPPVALPRRAALSYSWAGIDPPPRRLHPTG